MKIALKRLIQLINESIDALQSLSEAQKTISDGDFPCFELKRRYFVREFALLAERLIYFRGKSKQMDQKAEELLQEQLAIAKSIYELKGKDDSLLLEKFTSFRNKLLHKYLYSHHQGDETFYEQAKNYYTQNVNILKAALQVLPQGKSQATQLENQQGDVFLEKISYDASEQSPDKIDFLKNYLLPLETAIKEIEILLNILRHYKINLDSLVNKQKELAKTPGDAIKKADYETNKQTETENLTRCFRESPYLEGALENLLENISVSLGKTNQTYNLLDYDSLPSENSALLDHQEKLYKELDRDTSIFFNRIAQIRVNTAHEYESVSVANDFIHKFVQINRLYTDYLKKSLNFAYEKGYNSQLQSSDMSPPDKETQASASIGGKRGLYASTQPSADFFAAEELAEKDSESSRKKIKKEGSPKP